MIDPAVADSAVQQLLEAPGPIGFDIETAPLPEYAGDNKAGLDPYRSSIRLVQVYGGGSDAFVLDVAALGLKCLTPIWDHPLVAHNAVFELKHLLHRGAEPKRMGCTMLQANALRGGLPSLADLAQEWLAWEMPKDLQLSDWATPVLSDDQLAYAALDAVAVYRLFAVLAKELRDQGRVRVYTHMRDAQKAITRLELNGIYIDKTAHADLVAAWERDLSDAERTCREVLGAEVSPSSPRQVAAWLEANLDPKIARAWPKTTTEQLRTDAKTLARHDYLPLVAPLTVLKAAKKNLSTYGPSFAEHINPVTGRIHASFRLGGTATGRLSCRNPNIQNSPRDPAFRALFSAPQGRVLVVADYSQIELRVASVVSGDQAMMKAYADGEDLHRKTAAAIAGMHPDSVTSEQRRLAKAVNFGLLFGQGARGLAAYAGDAYGVNMTLAEARQARFTFLKTYKGLAKWQRQTAGASNRSGRVVTPGGRVRDLLVGHRWRCYTEALNTPIQGGAAEVLLAALARLEDHLAGLDARLVNAVHDELILEVVVDDAEPAKVALEKAMVAGFLAVFPEGVGVARNLVEARAAPNWAATK